ncbi:hypothetical protein ACFFX1_55680 [Dactylosporangium sucinum]|uniref:Uncharacterized protein n=1 Tax=Dactylosporangium sucinum TaxID=1424081 RepID=A0A917U209_9ACTN|nr:hypothetical protein [Dactylosporangium sucinum]GGM52196.1 hypothetical protein GCM10007977_062280 [Dactylosporangium sucinum]
MTAPRPRGRAELEHPSWCEVDKCSLETLGVGGAHQREFVVVGDDGKRVASVVLREYASGRVTIGAGSWLHREWSPREAELVAGQMVAAKRLLDESAPVV